MFEDPYQLPDPYAGSRVFSLEEVKQIISASGCSVSEIMDGMKSGLIPHKLMSHLTSQSIDVNSFIAQATKHFMTNSQALQSMMSASVEYVPSSSAASGQQSSFQFVDAKEEAKLVVDANNQQLGRCKFKKNPMVLYYPFIQDEAVSSSSHASASAASSQQLTVESWIQAVADNAFNDIGGFLEGLSADKLKDPQTRLILRAMLTQALIEQQAAIFNGAGEAKLDQLITNIVITCLGAGYNILNEASLAAKSENGADHNKKQVRYQSFLELAYATSNVVAIETFYQLGHVNLTEEQLGQYIRITSQKITDLLLPAIYYQRELPQTLKTLILNAISNPKTLIFANEIERIQVAKALLFCCPEYSHSVFGGGTKRIKEFYKKLFGEDPQAAAASSDALEAKAASTQSDATYYPGKKLISNNQDVNGEVQAFKTLLQNYALKNQNAKSTVEKYRTLRNSELTLPSRITTHLVANAVSLPPKAIMKVGMSIVQSQSGDQHAGSNGYSGDDAKHSTAEAELEIARIALLSKQLGQTQTKIMACLSLAQRINLITKRDLSALDVNRTNRTIAEHKVPDDFKAQLRFDSQPASSSSILIFLTVIDM